MKEIETLLQKYSDGTLSGEGLEQLNRLTHRDAIVGHATQKADTARRRRTVILSTTASVLLIAATGMTLFLRPTATGTGEAPLMAQQTREIRSTMQETPAVAPETPATTVAPAPSQKALQRAKEGSETPAPATPVAARPTPAAVEEMATPITETSNPVVACNTQCSPDSVINDIWRFLQV